MLYVGIDIENSGLFPEKGKDKIFCITVNDGKSCKLYTDPMQVKKLLEDPNVCKIIHNALHDCFWLYIICGIWVVNIWDSFLMEQLIIGDNPPPKCKDINILAELSANLYWTLKRYGLAELKDKEMGKLFATRPHHLPLTPKEKEYAIDDVRYLPQLQMLQYRRLASLDLLRVAAQENLVVLDTISMRKYGIRVDPSILMQIANENIATYTYITKRLPSSVSNWNSPAQVKKYFNSVGIPLKSLTEVTEDFVGYYNNEHLTAYAKARKCSTDASKYGTNLLIDKETGRSFVNSDGRVRCDFRQILNTGRFSVSKPPLHGLPREGMQRAAFIPDKGKVFIIGDFSGQETGIMAAASKEELWIKALLRGEDPLSLMASLMFPDWFKNTEKGCVFPKKCGCKLHKRDRQISKEITYGIAYGAYPKSISIKIKRTVKETSILFKKHRRAAPKLARYLDKNAADTVKTRISYSADVYRRRRTVRDPEEWQVRNVGYNNPIQSCAANMIKLAMISLDKRIPIVFVWHDELILEVPKKDAKKVAKQLQIVMEKAADYCTGIPGLIKVEPRIANNLLKQ